MPQTFLQGGVGLLFDATKVFPLKKWLRGPHEERSQASAGQPLKCRVALCSTLQSSSGTPLQPAASTEQVLPPSAPPKPGSTCGQGCSPAVEQVIAPRGPWDLR